MPLKKGKGGVLNKEKEFVPLSFHNGEFFKFGGSYKFRDVKYVNETIIYLGVYINQWGHFILDSLSRAWVLTHLNNEEKENVKVAFINKNGQIHGNYLDAITFLGINSKNVINVNSVIQAKKIIVPQMSMNEKHEYNKEYIGIFNTIVKNSNYETFNVPKRVYLSRTKLSEAKHKEFGEKNIEINFKYNGFEVEYPERLTLAQQISIFQKAEVIVSLNGSIPLNIVFASPNLKLIVINKTSIPHTNLQVLSKMKRIIPTYLDGYFEPYKRFPMSLGEGPFFIIFGRALKHFFEENQFNIITIEKISKFDYIRYNFVCIKVIFKNFIRKILKLYVNFFSS